MQSPVRIGTAGWSVPTRYLDQVPTGGSHLERYARRLNAAEINSSFYRPHQRKTYERWAQSTPPDFRFAIKIPKSMTHEKRLAGCEAELDRFVGEVTGLGSKLGVLLAQLPPKFGFDDKLADRFFRALGARIDTPVVLEPRHVSWFTPEVEKWLIERRIARVAADPARVAGADKPGGWTKLAYYRWHGSPRIYFSDYDTKALKALKQRIEVGRRSELPCGACSTIPRPARRSAMR